jgi:hypothetical protein
VCTSQGTAADGITQVDAKLDIMWDQHYSMNSANILADAGMTNCSVVCIQQYSCNGHSFGPQFTITRSLGTVTQNGQPVTQVIVTKQ